MGVKLGLSLTVFENRVLRSIFGPEREGVAGGWKKNVAGFRLIPHINLIPTRSSATCVVTGE
jgi:hypothetical protein